MRPIRHFVPCLVALFVVCSLRSALAAPDGGPPAVRIYDTQTPSNAALSGEALAKQDGWAQVAEDQAAHAFKGDAVLTNGRITIVLRASSPGAELYSVSSNAIAKRAVLKPAAIADGKLAAVKLVENTPASGKLAATFRSADGKTVDVTFELKLGQVFVAAEAARGSVLRVEAPSRFAVLPDFFADDIVIDAAALPGDKAELPSENFLLQMLPGHDAILMTVWPEREEDITVSLAGQGTDRVIDAAMIPCGKSGKVWVACLSAADIWHVCEVAKADAGKVIPTEWKAPLPAQWRVDWRRDDQLADSWEMIVQQEKGGFIKHGLFGSPGTIPADRKRWTTVLGSFPYPCWIDAEGKGVLQPLKSRAVTFDGPALFYPLSRIKETPLDAFTVVDIVRGTLGVGPCEYVLDVEGQKSAYKGRATCANRDTLNPIYQQGQQKAKKAEVEKSLAEVIVFIRHIRGRIEEYAAFGQDLLKYLGEQKKAHPELEKSIGELEALARRIDEHVTARRKAIKTPDEAAAMIEAFRKSYLDYEGADAFDKCKQFTAAIVDIGGNQDELAGECRMVTKMLRQRSGLMMAADPRLADIAREIRVRAQKVLRNPAGHEGARH